jgi:hypothetical protein
LEFQIINQNLEKYLQASSQEKIFYRDSNFQRFERSKVHRY